MSGADSWDRLWAPHRKDYLESQAGQFTADTCPFCLARDLNDHDGLVVHRGNEAYVVMNKFPYASGHLLICTNRHVPLYDEITDSERNEIGLLTQQAMRVLRTISRCSGFNIGMNQGSVAGAGVAGHLHQHVVPRWAGDSNFMPIVAGTRVMPELISQTRKLLSESWSNNT
jgi:ATP adenylyltransferase